MTTQDAAIYERLEAQEKTILRQNVIIAQLERRIAGLQRIVNSQGYAIEALRRNRDRSAEAAFTKWP